ncbi:MAG: MBOAT family protein [Pseudomonadota bacterium]
MIFNSFEFAVFFPLVFGLYWLLGQRQQNVLLLLASYFFYAFWDWRFLSLILLSTAVDFVVAQRVHAADAAATRKRWLLVSLIVNLGLLGVFKYFNFFLDSAVVLLEAVGLQANVPVLQIILPVGISFYTFQTLSYTIDVYRKDNEPTTNLIDFAVYVAYFPQLVAGPIERSTSLMPQIAGRRQFDIEQVWSGAMLALIGFFKKVFVADNLAPHVDAIFATPDPGFWTVVAGGYLFAFQIYADFSGYSDIARGTSRMLGVELRLNFDFPYASTSPQEFWRRWHISLSSWLRDYLYISLGGNRKGPVRTYGNLMATMVLGGLWHGAAWNYVLWGFYQGLCLCVHRWYIAHVKPLFRQGFVVYALKVLLYFQFTCYGWILFRAQSLGQVGDMTLGLFRGETFDSGLFLPLVQFALPMLLIEWLYTKERLPAPDLVRTVLYAGAFYLFVFHGEVSESFIYFQF